MRDRRYIPLKPVHQSEIQVDRFLFQHEQYQGFIAEPHQHGHMQITVPLAGRMHLQIGSEQQLIGPEASILLPSKVPHSVSYLDGGLDFLCVSLPGEWLEDIGRSIGCAADLGRPWVVADPFLWPLARQLASEVDRPGPGAERCLTLGLEQMGLLLMRGLIREDARPRTDPRILRAVDRILRDFAEPLTVEELAREVHLTPRHFERMFKTVVGTPPKRYLVDVRLRVARELLESTDLAIATIALDVGFNYPAHFISTFRAAEGLTPTAYRTSRRAHE